MDPTVSAQRGPLHQRALLTTGIAPTRSVLLTSVVQTSSLLYNRLAFLLFFFVLALVSSDHFFQIFFRVAE